MADFWLQVDAGLRRGSVRHAGHGQHDHGAAGLAAPLSARRLRSATRRHRWARSCAPVPAWIPPPSSSPRSRATWTARSIFMPMWSCIRRSRRRISGASRSSSIAAIQREKVTPVPMALRVFPGLLYGPQSRLWQSADRLGHGGQRRQAHARRPGEVPRDLVQAKQRHAHRGRRHYAGRTDAQARKLFDGWKAGAVPKKNIGAVDYPAEAGGLYYRPAGRAAVAHPGRRDRAAARTIRTRSPSRP